MIEKFLPYAMPVLTDADIDLAVKVMKSGMLTTGPYPQLLEKEFCRQFELEHAVSCSSGTAALHLAAVAMGLNESCSVLVPAVTFLATANAVRMTGAEVVFIDVDPENGIVTPGTVEAAARKAKKPVKALFVVHLGNRVVDLTSMEALAKTHSWKLLEDACHLIGTTYDFGGGNTGYIGDCRYSDFCAFSFHPTKTITSGEGGMIACKTPEDAEKLRLLRNHGMYKSDDYLNKAYGHSKDGNTNPWYYEMDTLGYNYRLSDIHAAIALGQIKRIDSIGEKRKELRKKYDKELSGISGLDIVHPTEWAKDSVGHLYQVLIDFEKFGINRKEFINQLNARNIGCQVNYIPLHKQPYYERKCGIQELTGAERFYSKTLSLPFHQKVSFSDVEFVSESIRSILAGSV